MSSYTYRDRDRDWDEPRSAVSVKRYVIPPEDGHHNAVVRRPASDWDDHGGAVARYDDRDHYSHRGHHPRDSDYDFADRDPGYYYHRRGHRGYDDDRPSRRELSPADSISQAGRRRDDRDYSSDDSMVYVRKNSDREEHPHHRRHLAEGAVVGVGAAELIRNRRRKGGDEVSDGLGRVGTDVGAGALGAAAVEAASRARNYYRSHSRPRGSDSHYDDDDSSHSSRRHRHSSRHRRSRSHGHRSRSRARSHSRTRTLATLGVGAAAIAAGVAFANKKYGAHHEDNRSRSRHRRHRSSSRKSSSRKSRIVDGPETDDDHHRSESQRRKHMAGAGLAGAAAAGLIDRARSHSRGGRSRSRSKIRQALPIVAGGLGAAGATGLYEKTREKKDERSRARDKQDRSRSRSRAPSEMYPDPSRDSSNLIEYGDRPLQGSIPAANYYGRSPTPPGYYSDATDPVASDAAGYGSSRRRDRSRSRSRSRSRPGSSSDASSSSDRGSRRRRRSRHGKSHSRKREAAGAALAAGGLGYAAHKYHQHKDRKSHDGDRDKLRFEDEESHDDPYGSHDPYEGSNNYMPYPPSPPPASGPHDGSPPGPGYLPPPPGPDPRYGGPAAAYPPADYPPPPGAGPPRSNSYGPRGREADAHVSTAGNDYYYYPPRAQYTRDGGSWGDHRGLRTRSDQEPGLETSPWMRPRASSQPFVSRDPRHHMDTGYEPDDSDSTIDSMDRKHRTGSHRRRRSSVPDRSKTPKQQFEASNEKEKDKDPTASDSDTTVDLPDRFDSQGRLLPEPGSEPRGSRLEELMKGLGVFA